jgi:hypothetical protein
MKARIAALAAVLVWTAAPLHAEKLPPDFRAAIETKFRKGFTFAVVTQPGVPTTSIYGVDGKSQSTAHFSIDVVNGQWKQSEGLLDFDQTAADFLNQGEVLELSSLSFKDNRVDMRFVSVEAHRVTRGGLFKSSQREPVATNFKFFFPFVVTSQADLPKALDYIGTYLRVFPSEQEARAFGARLLSGGGDEPRTAATSAPRKTSTSATATTTTKKEIKVGMTSLEVIDVLGKPQKEVSFENKTRWTYPDLTVVFENGRVKEVKF